MNVTDDDILTYIQVAPFPHSSAAIFGITGIIACNAAIRRFSRRNHVVGVAYSFGAMLSLGIAVFAEADARSRFQEYKRIRAVLVRSGWKQRIIEPVSYSRCQRDTALVAATRAGYGAEITQFFRNKGYRWYHIIPDALLKKPTYMFSRQFVRSSFFVKAYKPQRRYNTTSKTVA